MLDPYALLQCVVGLGRIELPTSPLSGVRSSQLSYRPGQRWWSWSGSNRRPPECKSGALPAELQPLVRNTNRGRLDARGGRRADPPTPPYLLPILQAEIPDEFGVERLPPCTLSAAPPTFS